MAGLGHFALFIAFALSSCAIPLDILGKWRSNARLSRSAHDVTIASFACLAIAVIALMIALAGSDFETAHAAWRTSLASASGYESTTPWPGTAGSLLFWLFAQTGFVLMAFGRCREDHREICANARVAANLVIVFFLLVLTFKINPFTFFDLNSPGGAALDLRLHNPALLMGYAAFVVPLAWSFAWLKSDNAQGSGLLLKQVRYGILASWFFLTVGVVFGALLIYRQVGSQGRWLQDVAQNVSLMPWLPATALLCGSRIYKRDAVAAKWIVALSLVTFTSCILATFVGQPDMPAGARKLFIILLIHIWVLAAVFSWRRYRRSTRGKSTRPNK